MAQNKAQADYGAKRTEARRAKAAAKDRVANAVEQLLESNGVEISEVGELKQIRLNQWDTTLHDEDGTIVTKTNKGASVVIDVRPLRDGPAWPVVQPAKPVSVRAPKASSGPALLKGWRTAIVTPDAQIGFLRAPDGVTLIPTHDPQAIQVAEMIHEAERPEISVDLGDLLDLAEMSHYRLEPSMVATTQPALDEAYRYLAVKRELTRGRMWVHEGNHDQRLANYIIDNAMAAFALKRANAPHEWPTLSVPYLLRFDELGVEYIDGYPANWQYINERLATVHGAMSGTAGVAAAKMVNSELVNVIFGHDHKAATVWRTRGNRTTMTRTFAHSPGTLARVDGAVPGAGKYRGRHIDGTPVRSWQQWQQGITIVRYVPGDGPVTHDHVNIENGVAYYGGQEFRATVELPQFSRPGRAT
jgi:hypothetical protein